ncbi:hypothetical protein CY34DRAFT_814448 [Suillus luteus UH-Slu-Lm8-n1]|uniref:Uncharacterized protein n=1 Tax=Suillus luteus UH-Slu-Lm8-n1 TaxID=930992 RepID=A0A0D0ACM9_9AGAM|nr:hypothetical protein CY34DRAFT_814448 [Suillus luteus UH-Slu-Lm8-n1]
MSVQFLPILGLQSTFKLQASGQTFLTSYGGKLLPRHCGKHCLMLFIREVLDIYQKGANGRYGSLAAPSTAGLSSLSLRVCVYLPMQTSVSIFYDSDSEDDIPKVAPHFTCRQRKFDLHSHTLA